MFRKNKIRGQISLELGLAFLCAFILLVGSVKICAWIAGRMVVRQEEYNRTRQAATAGASIGEQVDESDTNRFAPLNIFN